MIQLVGDVPVRELRNSTRCLTGKVDLRSGGTASFESSLERDWLIVLDFDPNVRKILVQPFTVKYGPKGSRPYTPDILAEAEIEGRSRTVVYEVKPREELRAEWLNYRARFRAALAYCRSRGWSFKIVTEKEIRTPLLENALFLKRYRSLKVSEIAEQELLFTLRGLGPCTPQSLVAAAYWHREAQMAALPVLWHLIANRKIGAVLHERLTMRSSIWLPMES